jgi:hypothetical protein
MKNEFKTIRKEALVAYLRLVIFLEGLSKTAKNFSQFGEIWTDDLSYARH